MRRDQLGSPKLSSELHFTSHSSSGSVAATSASVTLCLDLDLVTQPLLAIIKPDCLSGRKTSKFSFIVPEANRLTTGSLNQGLIGQ